MKRFLFTGSARGNTVDVSRGAWWQRLDKSGETRGRDGGKQLMANLGDHLVVGSTNLDDWQAVYVGEIVGVDPSGRTTYVVRRLAGAEVDGAVFVERGWKQKRKRAA